MLGVLCTVCSAQLSSGIEGHVKTTLRSLLQEASRSCIHEKILACVMQKGSFMHAVKTFFFREWKSLHGWPYAAASYSISGPDCSKSAKEPTGRWQALNPPIGKFKNKSNLQI